jgi:hypothetical protein
MPAPPEVNRLSISDAIDNAFEAGIQPALDSYPNEKAKAQRAKSRQTPSCFTFSDDVTATGFVLGSHVVPTVGSRLTRRCCGQAQLSVRPEKASESRRLFLSHQSPSLLQNADPSSLNQSIPKPAKITVEVELPLLSNIVTL